MAAAHADQLVAVFTHGGVIGEALAQTASSARLAFSASDNASISQVIIGPGLRAVRRFNDTSHLARRFASVAAPPV